MRLMISLAVTVLAAVGTFAWAPPTVSRVGSAEYGSVRGSDSLYNWCGDWLAGDCNTVTGQFPLCTQSGADCDECTKNYTLSSCFLQTGYTCFYDIFDCGRLEQGTCSSGPPYTCQNKTDVRDCWDIQITLVNCP